MFAYYYNNEAVRWLTVLVAFLYSIFYSGLQLISAAAFFYWVAGVPQTIGLILMAAIVWFYVVTGGLEGQYLGGRASVFAAGGRHLPVGVLRHYLGCHRRLDRFFPERSWNWTTGTRKCRDCSISVSGAGWTAAMILTYMFALMGIQSSPAFTLWNFGIKSPKPLAWQQVFMSTFVVGPGPVSTSLPFKGLGAKILELEGVIAPKVDGDVVPMLMTQFLPGPVLGLVFPGCHCRYPLDGGPVYRYRWHHTAARCLLAIHPQTGGQPRRADLGQPGPVHRRDAGGRGRESDRQGCHRHDRRLCHCLRVRHVFALLGVHWGWRFPSLGATLGMIAGIVACFLTYYVWRYPLSMHTAFWGLFAGLTGRLPVPRAGGAIDSEETRQRQAEVRAWLDSVDGPSEKVQEKWRFWMKILVPVWFFFAIGPACLLGNKAFSFCGFPALWSWQIVWWILGIIMMWALCFKAEMSTTSDEQIRRADDENMIVVKEV
jgi:SSS family solute:Na+ symporter